MPPSVDHTLLRVPRAGSAEADYEDAAAVRGDRWPVRGAVADGATESAFARRWARILAEGIAGSAWTTEAFEAAVSEWRREWQASVAPEVADRPWYVSAKASEGAHATILGVSLHPNGDWRALSIGDCCLFHLRSGELVRAWPFEDPDAFGHRPALVSSRPDQPVPVPDATTGAWRADDVFLLTTDALGEWLLRVGPDRALSFDRDTVGTTVETARAEGALRNDDVTLLSLRIGEGASSDPSPSST